LLLDPIDSRLGLPSFEGDLASGRRGRFFSFLVSGWVCGWLWEFWNFWAAAKWHYTFPIMQGSKIFEMPAAGFAGFPPFAVECLVMYYFAAWLLGWERPLPGLAPSQTPEMRSQNVRAASRPLTMVSWILLAALLYPQLAHASSLHVPETARQGLDLLYAGRSEDALALFHQVRSAHPDNPLGYILEAEARWWQIYCEACEVKWNTIDAWQRPRTPADQEYLDLTDKIITVAESHIARADSAEMELYDSMGWMLRARFQGLRNDRMGTARAGVNARAHALRCLQLDPQMADAYTGLGLYNYLADALSPIARLLRFLMRIPGGSKKEGIRQLEIAMNQGDLLRVEARFYLAKNLRNYDLDYSRSLEVLQPLIDQFPRNPIFQLIRGDNLAKLGRGEQATNSFREAEQLSSGDTLCDRHLRALAGQSATAFAGMSTSH